MIVVDRILTDDAIKAHFIKKGFSAVAAKMITEYITTEYTDTKVMTISNLLHMGFTEYNQKDLKNKYKQDDDDLFDDILDYMGSNYLLLADHYNNTYVVLE